MIDVGANPVYAKGRCCGRGERILNDLECVEEINKFNEDLNLRL